MRVKLRGNTEACTGTLARGCLAGEASSDEKRKKGKKKERAKGKESGVMVLIRGCVIRREKNVAGLLPGFTATQSVVLDLLCRHSNVAFVLLVHVMDCVCVFT